MSRVGRGVATGVDRVERAYLDAFLAAPKPVFGLIHTPRTTYLMDRAGMQFLRRRFEGADWGPRDAFARLHLRLTPLQQAARAALRRHAVGANTLPEGPGVYFNVGHSNLRRERFEALGDAGFKRCVMIHDTIPLDYPAYQRAEVPDQFRAKLDVALDGADLILANSHATQADITRHARVGRLPPITVAPLGVTPPQPDPIHPLPEAPYFVALGTIEPRKNLSFLLDIWDSFASDTPPIPVPQLHIIGARGWESEAVLRRLDAHPQRGSTIVEHGPLPDGAAAALLSGAAGLLFPSLAEGYGLPPIEALSLGTTPLCAPLPIYRETLGDKGIYASTHDVYLWRQQILNLVSAQQAGPNVNHRERTPFHPPTWDEHFAAVFAEI